MAHAITASSIIPEYRMIIRINVFKLRSQRGPKCVACGISPHTAEGLNYFHVLAMKQYLNRIYLDSIYFLHSLFLVPVILILRS